jgi:hypothetical protein
MNSEAFLYESPEKIWRYFPNILGKYFEGSGEK